MIHDIAPASHLKKVPSCCAEDMSNVKQIGMPLSGKESPALLLKPSFILYVEVIKRMNPEILRDNSIPTEKVTSVCMFRCQEVGGVGHYNCTLKCY